MKFGNLAEAAPFHCEGAHLIHIQGAVSISAASRDHGFRAGEMRCDQFVPADPPVPVRIGNCEHLRTRGRALRHVLRLDKGRPGQAEQQPGRKIAFISSSFPGFGCPFPPNTQSREEFRHRGFGNFPPPCRLAA